MATAAPDESDALGHHIYSYIVSYRDTLAIEEVLRIAGNIAFLIRWNNSKLKIDHIDLDRISIIITCSPHKREAWVLTHHGQGEESRSVHRVVSVSVEVDEGKILIETMGKMADRQVVGVMGHLNLGM